MKDFRQKHEETDEATTRQQREEEWVYG